MGKQKMEQFVDKKMLKSYDYWQFWRNTDDKDVIKFLNVHR